MSRSDAEIIERRRTVLRVSLFFVILGTMPFYLLGFVLWGTTPDRQASVQLTTQAPQDTPISNTATNTLSATNTLAPLPTSAPLGPTPGQFFPPVIVPTNTFVPVIIPTATPAPTLTPFPTNTPPPTNTEVIVIPTFTPVPTNTDPPPPTAELPTPLPPPSDTPEA